MHDNAPVIENSPPTFCGVQLPNLLTAGRASEVTKRQRFSKPSRLLAVFAGLSRRSTSCCFCSPLSPLPGYAHARESEAAREPPAKSARSQKVRIAWFLAGRKSPEMAVGTDAVVSTVCACPNSWRSHDPHTNGPGGVAKGRAAVNSPAERRPPKSPHVARSLVQGRAQHGPRLAKHRKPGATWLSPRNS